MAITAFTDALGAGAGSSIAGYSVRTPVTLSAGQSAQRVRVTFKASSSGLSTNNCAIGVQSSTYVTTATPVELKFSGVSGFTLGANASITSDWVDLNTTNGGVAVVIFDLIGTGTQAVQYGGGLASYIKAATASYNVASPSGFSATGLNTAGVAQVDVALANTVVASPGNYSLAGVAAFLGRQFIIAALKGTYALTGVAISVRRSIRLLNATGGYVLAGSAARLGRGIRFAATNGSYVLTGAAAQMRRGYRILCAVGAYAVTGVGIVQAAVSTQKVIRRTRFVLQKLRATPPTLDQ